LILRGPRGETSLRNGFPGIHSGNALIRSGFRHISSAEKKTEMGVAKKQRARLLAGPALSLGRFDD
jgi:hypothetical protein